MIVTPIDNDYVSRIEGPPSSTGERSRDSRPHLTDILRDMAEAAGISKNRADISEDDLNSFAAGGWLFERVFDTAFADALSTGDMVNAGEFECDGIVGTPDRIDWRTPKIIETKCRWRSARSFESLESNYWIELMQVAAYCHMTQIMEADLVVFFVAGNWRPPVPIVRAAHLEFTERELAERWRSIVGHAKWRGWL